MSASAEVAVRQPWDKRPGESQTAFVSFTVYRDMPPPRSVEKTAAIVGKSIGTLSAHSAKYGWVERAHAYDLHVDQERQRARLAQIKEADERTLQLGKLLQGEAIRGAVGQRAGVREDGSIVEEREPIVPESAADIARYAESGTKLVRLTLGLPTDLSKALDTFSLREVQAIVGEIADLTLPLLPEEDHEAWIRGLREIGKRASGASG